MPHPILLVDDDPRVLTSVGRGLEVSEFLVLTAVDGVAALEAVRRSSPTLGTPANTHT
ncbi:hypothetical protein [Hoyosella altamirensis]|uniref:DNA-binding response OmpR family regulator n=1 Tax=Hoyosella altamirensis TaxID=616997 RepID=A0A839RVI7_9ACTN|nr:hypothetical protein [Hoyosella altamirensis]MBB3040034.1 DNA-binding response OmpR family regulator [Hoyosella altamirensis]